MHALAGHPLHSHWDIRIAIIGKCLYLPSPKPTDLISQDVVWRHGIGGIGMNPMA